MREGGFTPNELLQTISNPQKDDFTSLQYSQSQFAASQSKFSDFQADPVQNLRQN
jgi:hypothetical protein